MNVVSGLLVNVKEECQHVVEGIEWEAQEAWGRMEREQSKMKSKMGREGERGFEGSGEGGGGWGLAV